MFRYCDNSSQRIGDNVTFYVTSTTISPQIFRPDRFQREKSQERFVHPRATWIVISGFFLLVMTHSVDETFDGQTVTDWAFEMVMPCSGDETFDGRTSQIDLFLIVLTRIAD
jgi:hypothetical protein